MIEKLCDNLNIFMAEKRINANELARQTGLPASTIKKIRNRDNPNPTLSTLMPIAQFFSVTISELLGEETTSSINAAKDLQNSLKVPLISWEAAINWPMTANEAEIAITTKHGYSKDVYALRVEEDDGKYFLKGTLLIIDPAIKSMHRDMIIVHKSGQQKPSLKQALYDEGQLYLKPVTHDYQLSVFTSEHKILGVLMEYRNQIKQPENNITTILKNHTEMEHGLC